MVYCGPVVSDCPLHHQKLSLYGWTKANPGRCVTTLGQVWTSGWGWCKMRQNSMMFTEVLSHAVVTRSFQWAVAVRMCLYAEIWDREEFVDLFGSLLGLQCYLHSWHYSMSVSLYLPESALLNRKKWSEAVAQQWVVQGFGREGKIGLTSGGRTRGFFAFPD